MEWLLDNVWVGWLVLIVVFLIIEMLSLEFTFLTLAAGSVIGLLSGLLGLPWWAQLLVGAVASMLLLLLVKPRLLALLHRGEDPTKSNIDALIGSAGSVTSTVDANTGQVKLANGESWTARLAPSASLPALPPGARITVRQVSGATVVVAPTEGGEGA